MKPEDAARRFVRDASERCTDMEKDLREALARLAACDHPTTTETPPPLGERFAAAVDTCVDCGAIRVRIAELDKGRAPATWLQPARVKSVVDAYKEAGALADAGEAGA
jgi:hypothetical protein